MTRMDSSKPWFRPKRYGYGAGLPIAWQGWVVIGLYIAGIAAAGAVLRPRMPIAFFAAVLALTAALVWIAARKTQGGWRWRRGDSD